MSDGQSKGDGFCVICGIRSAPYDRHKCINHSDITLDMRRRANAFARIRAAVVRYVSREIFYKTTEQLEEIADKAERLLK